MESLARYKVISVVLTLTLLLCPFVGHIPAWASDNDMDESIPNVATAGTTDTEIDNTENSGEDTDGPTDPVAAPSSAIGTFGIVPSEIELFASTSDNQPSKIVSDNHTLMTRVDGRFFVWGDNTYGQLGLGDGSPTKIYAPIENTFFKDKGLKIKDIYVVEDASFVLCSNGETYSFGKGLNGRLGLGSTTSTSTPTLIPGSQNLRFDKLYCGKEFVLAATGNNEIYGWGRNNSGQVGDDTKVDVTAPKLIMSGADIKYLETGADFALLIKQNNSLYCWGNNDNGRYGFDTGTIAPSNTALTSSGTCSHVNVTTNVTGYTYGQYGLSNGNTTPCSPLTYTRLTTTCNGNFGTTYAGYGGAKGNNQQIKVKQFLKPQNIAMANRSFVNPSTISTVWNPSGTAGIITNNVMNFSSTYSASHTHTAPSATFSCSQYHIFKTYNGDSAESRHASSTGNTGTAAVGSATVSRTGQAASWQYVLPNAYAYFDTGKASELYLGNRHGIAKIDGTYYGWGDNALKQQGTSGNDNGYMVPLTQINTFINNLDNTDGGFDRLMVVGDTNYIISGSRNVYAWGSNTNGKGGIGSTSSYIDTPTKLSVLDGLSIATIIPGRSHVLYITQSGDVYASGDNLYGQLGLGDEYVDEIKSTSPVKIETFQFSEVAARPDAPDNIDTPDEVEKGTDFEIHWTSVGNASSYEIVRHFTPDSGSDTLLFAASIPDQEVVYTGDQTTFTDTVFEEGTVYYTGHAVSNFGDKSVGTTSSDIRIIPSSSDGDNNGGNNDGDNNNNNNGGGSGVDKDYLDSIIAMFKEMSELQQQMFLESLRSNGASDELIADILALSGKGGDVNVSVPGLDKDTLAIIAAMNENGRGGQVGTPTTNVYNQPSDLSGIVELLGTRELESDVLDSSAGTDDLLNRALTVAVLKLLLPSDTVSANTSVQPPSYQTESSTQPPYLSLYLIISIIFTMIVFIVIRFIPETDEEG